MNKGARRLATGIFFAGLLLSVGLPAQAGRQIEAVGAVLVPEQLSTSGRQQARDAAFGQAVLDAVLRVAGDLVRADRAARESSAEPDATGAVAAGAVPAGETGSELGTGNVEQETPEALNATLRKLFGHHPRRYTNRFELEEDRGVQARLFVQSGDPNLQSEYVVMARVEVDVAGVRHRLEEKGLIAARAVVAPEALEQVQLVLMDLPSYSTYAQVLTSLRAQAGVRSASPLSFERGRSVLGVETDLAPRALAHLLEMGLPGNLVVTGLAIEGRQIELRVQSTPTADLEAAGEGNGSSAPRPLMR